MVGLKVKFAKFISVDVIVLTERMFRFQLLTFCTNEDNYDQKSEAQKSDGQKNIDKLKSN